MNAETQAHVCPVPSRRIRAKRERLLAFVLAFLFAGWLGRDSRPPAARLRLRQKVFAFGSPLYGKGL